MPPESRRTLALAVACLCGLACADAGEDTAKPDPADVARATLAEAPEEVRREVQRGCDKWKTADGSGCDEAAVERDQLACWLAKGLPNLKVSIAHEQRPYFQKRRVLLHQQSCMQRRGWRLQKPGELLATE